MCIVTGKKWSEGKYKLERKKIVEKSKKESVILEIANGVSKLSRSVKHIHYNSETAIIWFEGSRLGLLYEIVPPSP